MKNLFWLPLILFLAWACTQKGMDVKKEFDFASKQYERMLKAHTDTTQFPQSINPDGTFKTMPAEWWCSGFFGGSLWYLYEYTQDEKWKTEAHRWTMAVEKEKYNTTTHDLGFMLYCPFGNGYRLTKNEAYVEPMLTGAKSLATRFHPEYGVIKSWDGFGDYPSYPAYTYPVIIDNMMNLEFLFWAAKQSGNKEFYNICVSHADSTIKNHYRADYSSYHVVCYAPGGKVLAKKTHQGHSDESAWSRGQAWGLYGYTVMYRETRDTKYLAQAEKIADFILHHPNLPNNKIPYWDFNAPTIPKEERDVSAAALMASALLELQAYVPEKSAEYRLASEIILASLSSSAYKAKLGENRNFILMHSVGAKPLKSEIDVPLVYADYYYLEALLRYDRLAKGK